MSENLSIERPTLILSKKRAIRNIERMVRKAQGSGVRFRPHFKTHRSAQIGEWFRGFGVECITVASVEMARYFAKSGWRDITIAFPVNLREIGRINELARQVQLSLLVESSRTVLFLRQNLTSRASVWIDIDTGYHRTGIASSRPQEVVALASEIARTPSLSFSGILTHAGHSYEARSKHEIEAVHTDTVNQMGRVRDALESAGFSEIQVSVGDTPTCSTVDNFGDVDEIRPGNFVFYDLRQLSIGACAEEDIAIAVACPVVSKNRSRSEIVIYGGLAHLSGDSLLRENGTESYGAISRLGKKGWGPRIDNAFVSHLSQVHGLVKADGKLFEQIRVGDALMILPVHSCLLSYLLKEYRTLDGDTIQSASSVQSQVTHSF